MQERLRLAAPATRLGLRNALRVKLRRGAILFVPGQEKLCTSLCNSTRQESRRREKRGRARRGEGLLNVCGEWICVEDAPDVIAWIPETSPCDVSRVLVFTFQIRICRVDNTAGRGWNSSAIEHATELCRMGGKGQRGDDRGRDRKRGLAHFTLHFSHLFVAQRVPISIFSVCGCEISVSFTRLIPALKCIQRC